MSRTIIQIARTTAQAPCNINTATTTAINRLKASIVLKLLRVFYEFDCCMFDQVACVSKPEVNEFPFFSHLPMTHHSFP